MHLVKNELCSRGLHGSKNSCPNPKETRNVLHRTDPDPSIISKAGPGPVQIREMPNRTRPGPVYYLKPGPETAGKTQTRLDPIVIYSTLNCYYKSINLLRKIQLFVLPNLRSRGSVVVSSPFLVTYLTGCDHALQSSDKKVIHVIPLVIPSPSLIHSLFQLQKST